MIYSIEGMDNDCLTKTMHSMKSSLYLTVRNCYVYSIHVHMYSMYVETGKV